MTDFIDADLPILLTGRGSSPIFQPDADLRRSFNRTRISPIFQRDADFRGSFNGTRIFADLHGVMQATLLDLPRQRRGRNG
jgi:hypothetical protein